MRRTRIMELIIGVLLLALIVNVYNDYHKPKYKTKPEVVVNRAIWLTELRIHDALSGAVEARILSIKELGALTLGGGLWDQFNAMAGDKVVPRVNNVYAFHQYLLAAQDGTNLT